MQGQDYKDMMLEQNFIEHIINPKKNMKYGNCQRGYKFFGKYQIETMKSKSLRCSPKLVKLKLFKLINFVLELLAKQFPLSEITIENHPV